MPTKMPSPNKYVWEEALEMDAMFMFILEKIDVLGTRALLMERRDIIAEPLEKNSPKPAMSSRLICLCFL
jgi:hypothetical protein